MKYSSTSPRIRPPAPPPPPPPRPEDIPPARAEIPSAARDARAAAARAHQPHLDHVGFDDGADVHAVALRHARMRDAPAAIRALPALGAALIGLPRIAPRRG